MLIERFSNFCVNKTVKAIQWLFRKLQPLSLKPYERTLLELAERTVLRHLISYDGLNLIIKEAGYLADSRVSPAQIFELIYSAYPTIQLQVKRDGVVGGDDLVAYKIKNILETRGYGSRDHRS
jgi:hypothetical protein